MDTNKLSRREEEYAEPGGRQGVVWCSGGVEGALGPNSGFEEMKESLCSWCSVKKQGLKGTGLQGRPHLVRHTAFGFLYSAWKPL